MRIEHQTFGFRSPMLVGNVLLSQKSGKTFWKGIL